MRIKYIYITIIIVFLLNANLFSQERIYVDKKQFKVTEDGFKTAWQFLKQGNFQFYQHRAGSYLKAINYYKEAYTYNPENAELNMLIGISYLRSFPKTKSLKYIQKAISLDTDVHSKSTFLLGRAFHVNKKYTKAIIEYEDYKSKLSDTKKEKLTPIVDKYIDECENGIKLEKVSIRALVDNMGENINSSFDDYNVVLSVDENEFFFTSRRGEEEDRINPIDDKYFEDIYLAKKEEKKWLPATKLPKPLNSKWNDAAIDFSEDGDKLIIYRG